MKASKIQLRALREDRIEHEASEGFGQCSLPSLGNYVHLQSCESRDDMDRALLHTGWCNPHARAFSPHFGHKPAALRVLTPNALGAMRSESLRSNESGTAQYVKDRYVGGDLNHNRFEVKIQKTHYLTATQS